MIETMARDSQVTATAMKARRRQRRHEAGFTLIELLTVVAIVAVLAVLAVVSYNKFIKASHVSEANYMVGSIRAAEESYRAETMTYLDVSTSLTAWYPRAPGKYKSAWDNPGNSDYTKWRQLGARSDGPVYFGYAVKAGAAGAQPPTPATTTTFTWPNPTIEPWYVIQAASDLDANSVFCHVVTSSFSGEVYVENEGE